MDDPGSTLMGWAWVVVMIQAAVKRDANGRTKYAMVAVDPGRVRHRGRPEQKERQINQTPSVCISFKTQVIHLQSRACCVVCARRCARWGWTTRGSWRCAPPSPRRSAATRYARSSTSTCGPHPAWRPPPPSMLVSRVRLFSGTGGCFRVCFLLGSFRFIAKCTGKFKFRGCSSSSLIATRGGGR